MCGGGRGANCVVLCWDGEGVSISMYGMLGAVYPIQNMFGM